MGFALRPVKEGPRRARTVKPPAYTRTKHGLAPPPHPHLAVLTASAVKPSTLHLFNGLQATFVNEDTAPRSIGVDAARSDQAGCAAVAMVLQPGERKMTDPLPRFAACYFRDAQRPGDTAFQGVVVTH
jgi:hypothetical protein